jgi:RimJ/RimL family protein N-acetyltransferase
MQQKPFIEGKTVDLRPLTLDDVNDTYISWLNDAEVCAHNSHRVYPYTRKLAVEYVTRVQSQKNDLVLAVIAKDTKKHIGNISLQNVHPVNRSAEFAVILGDKGYWGKGIGKEASGLIIKHGFTEMNLHRVWMGTQPDNTAMQKIAAALGFVDEGRSREEEFRNGKFNDVIRYGLLREEFTG